MFARKRLEIITGGVFLSITLILCVFGWLSYRNYETYRQAQERIARVSEQLRALNVTMSTLQDAETGQRGYLLTRKPAYLEPYARAESSVAANLVWLRKAFASEPRYDDELKNIEKLKRSKFAELEKTIALARAGNLDAALRIVNSGQGKQTMDEVRATVWALIVEKRRELAAIQAASIKGTRGAERATIAFALAIGMFLLAAYGYLIYDLRDRRRLRSSGRSTDSLDLLTGAYNSSYLSRALATSVKYADRDSNAIALIMIDVRISTQAEDAAADKHALIVATANQLARSVSDPNLVARLDATTFAVLIQSFRDRDDLAAIAQKIVNDLTLALIPTVSDKYTDVRAGIAVYPDDARNAQELLAFAKLAMEDEAHGRNSRYNFYQNSGSHLPRREEILINGLHRAIASNGFTLRYQPHVVLATGELIGAEALIRWEHPELGPISPDEFIPIAERTGLIIPIGAWVLQSACREAAAWRSAGSTIRLAVNVSALQLEDQDFLSIVHRSLSDSGLEPSCLEIELTERVMTDPHIGELLEQVRSFGVQISIDDFGTGYSSLSYLSRFPANVLKIDRSFVTNVPGSERDNSVARTVINIGRELGITTIAEGVETREQADFLARHGCDVGQGYLFYKPMPALELRALLAQGERAA